MLCCYGNLRNVFDTWIMIIRTHMVRSTCWTLCLRHNVHMWLYICWCIFVHMFGPDMFHVPGTWIMRIHTHLYVFPRYLGTWFSLTLNLAAYDNPWVKKSITMAYPRNSDWSEDTLCARFGSPHRLQVVEGLLARSRVHVCSWWLSRSWCRRKFFLAMWEA